MFKNLVLAAFVAGSVVGMAPQSAFAARAYSETKVRTKATAAVEQGPSIGSQSKGAGAGKVTFNPFSITR